MFFDSPCDQSPGRLSGEFARKAIEAICSSPPKKKRRGIQYIFFYNFLWAFDADERFRKWFMRNSLVNSIWCKVNQISTDDAWKAKHNMVRFNKNVFFLHFLLSEFNPLMPKTFFSTSKFIVFAKQKLQAANWPFNPLVPIAHTSECQNIPFTLPANWRGFLFFAPSALMG